MRRRRTDDPFERAFRSRYGEILRLATRILGDRAAAEDVAQEAFSRLADHGVLDRDEEQVAAWLRRVTMNTAFNRLRGERRRGDREQRSARAEDRATAADEPLPATLRAEERGTVRAVLANLPERQRLCLLLRHSGYSYAEVAAASGLAIGSVGVVLARAEAAFRDEYLRTDQALRTRHDHDHEGHEGHEGADHESVS